MPDGAEVVLGLGREHKVEVGDALLGGLERVFGEQVAELQAMALIPEYQLSIDTGGQ